MIHNEVETVNPSERILPQNVRENKVIKSVLTTNWKDGAFEHGTKPIQTQLMAIALIICQIVLAGTYSIVNGEHVALGAVTTLYATSGLLGYFGVGNSPILVFGRANINALVLGCGFFISMLISGFSAGSFALMAALIFDGS
jgi:hypothetical protein